MRHIILFIAFALIIPISSNAQNIVGLHNGGEMKYKQLKLKNPAFSKSYLLADDSVKYSLDLVNYYQIGSDYYKKKFSNSGNYEFMKRELEGTISLFSVMRTTQSFDPNTGIPYSSSSKVNFYGKSNGSIKKVNSKNLKMDLADCEACQQEIKKAKTLGIISAIGLTAGLGIFIGTAASELSKTQEPGESTSFPPGAIIGTALCFTPLILSGSRRRHYSNAIAIYNERN